VLFVSNRRLFSDTIHRVVQQRISGLADLNAQFITAESDSERIVKNGQHLLLTLLVGWQEGHPACKKNLHQQCSNVLSQQLWETRPKLE